MQTQLSVVIITLNEEKNIARCLDSIREEICMRYPQVNFIQKEWGGYAKTKNFANQQAKNNFILSIDADEALSEKLKKSIKKISDTSSVYQFNRLTNYCGKWVKHCGWYPDKKTRIFPKDTVYWQGDYVHETLFVPNNLPTHFLKGDLLHYSYYNEKEHLLQIENYAHLNAQKKFHEGKKTPLLKGWFSVLFKFVKSYFLQLGFLDGYYGFVICKNSAYAKYLKYKKLQTLYQNK